MSLPVCALWHTKSTLWHASCVLRVTKYAFSFGIQKLILLCWRCNISQMKLVQQICVSCKCAPLQKLWHAKPWTVTETKNALFVLPLQYGTDLGSQPCVDHLSPVTSLTAYSPVIIMWYRSKRWVEAVKVICSVTLITHELFFRFILSTTDTTCTVFALASRIVFTEITLWLILTCKQWTSHSTVQKSHAVLLWLDYKNRFHTPAHTRKYHVKKSYSMLKPVKAFLFLKK